MNPQHILFADSYLNNGFNAAGAAVSAAYAPSSARQSGHRLLQRPDVHSYIANKACFQHKRREDLKVFVLTNLQKIIEKAMVGTDRTIYDKARGQFVTDRYSDGSVVRVQDLPTALRAIGHYIRLTALDKPLPKALDLDAFIKEEQEALGSETLANPLIANVTESSIAQTADDIKIKTLKNVIQCNHQEHPDTKDADKQSETPEISSSPFIPKKTISADVIALSKTIAALKASAPKETCPITVESGDPVSLDRRQHRNVQKVAS